MNIFHQITLLFIGASLILPASAQHPPEIENSHLSCIPGKVTKYNMDLYAWIQLIANMKQYKYTLNKCVVRYGKGVELCVPSTKKILDSNNVKFPYGVLQSSKEVANATTPQRLTNDFICYWSRCKIPNKVPKGQWVADQFGMKKIKLRRSNLMKTCVPAWKFNNDGNLIVLE